MAGVAPDVRSTDPRAWSASSLDEPRHWYVCLSSGAQAELENALARFREAPRPVETIRSEEYSLTALDLELEPARTALEPGRGFVIIRGLDVGRCSTREAQVAYWLVGSLLGAPFAQNVQGTVLYDVRDTGRSVTEGARFSVTNAESSFHTDNSFGDTVLDYVGLLCLKTARSGGLSQNVSGYAAVDVLRRNHPELLHVLEQPFLVDRRGGFLQGESPTVPVPVLTWRDGELLVRYLRYWIEAGHDRAGQPLAPEQRRALDTLDAVLNRPDLRAEFALFPGDMFFINNRWILHNRTAFEDHQEPEHRRHLVRLWLRR